MRVNTPVQSWKISWSILLPRRTPLALKLVLLLDLPLDHCKSLQRTIIVCAEIPWERLWKKIIVRVKGHLYWVRLRIVMIFETCSHHFRSCYGGNYVIRSCRRSAWDRNRWLGSPTPLYECPLVCSNYFLCSSGLSIAVGPCWCCMGGDGFGLSWVSSNQLPGPHQQICTLVLYQFS